MGSSVPKTPWTLGRSYVSRAGTVADFILTDLCDSLQIAGRVLPYGRLLEMLQLHTLQPFPEYARHAHVSGCSLRRTRIPLGFE